MKADTRGARLWVWLALLLALAAGLAYMTHMPGRSHSGPLPPLSGAEAELRERLGQQVVTGLAGVALDLAAKRDALVQ